MMRLRLMIVMMLMLLAPVSALAGTVQLPQTGQTTCWDTSGNVIACPGTGQDGAVRAGAAWPNPRFTVQGDCVTDNLTGLMWPRNGNLASGTRTWQGALDFAGRLELCGHSDWRMPNVREMVSLINAEQVNNADWLNGQGFINVQARRYWSSTTHANVDARAWNIYMVLGDLRADFKESTSYYVWPVRTGQ